MESNSTKDPPNSNEAWFNEESSNIMAEKIDSVISKVENNHEHQIVIQNPDEEGLEKIDNENPPFENLQAASDANTVPGDDKAIKDKVSQRDMKNDISPDELDIGNQFLPTGCEINSPEFNDDRDVEIINAFKQGNFISL